ncbi:peroxisome biogenesis protein 22-like isoform X2 [Nymphaea colorata]|uniref:peroxisome biogenesis protein 22-like isoform X2 n=1 Tax=Nymphaea colorata TaxID=210225 RepID=UPI00129EDC55|nr:peroxisome biogenesis protein 22-like isoform X2 [Nymphaea colorata]
MASDSLINQIHHLFNRFNALLTAKISDLVLVLSNHKSAGSIGALAGLAIAIVFTWKFLKTPDRHRRRQQKRRGSSSNIGAENPAHNVAPSSEESHLLNAMGHTEIEEFHPPMKLSLGQIVRKKLNGGKKMTCQLLGVILEERTPEELQKHATVRPSVVEVLLAIAKYCDLYLMERILDDESSEIVLSALETAGLFTTGGLNKDKVLFCSTENGRTSFVRQLEPDWHVDSSSEIVSQLARFIRNQLHVSPAGSSYMAPNIFSSISLEQYFSIMDQN